MTLRQYLILMSIGAALCWVAWFFLLFSVDPEHAGWTGFVFFYASLFLATLGSFSVVGFLIKKKLVKDDDIVFRHVKRTFRQGTFTAMLLISLLLLLQWRYLNWWNGALSIVFFVILEGIVFTNRKHSNRDYV